MTEIILVFKMQLETFVHIFQRCTLNSNKHLWWSFLRRQLLATTETLEKGVKYVQS